MSDYKTFCQHYDLDPMTPDARAQYREYQQARASLDVAAAKAETREAIDKAKR